MPPSVIIGINGLNNKPEEDVLRRLVGGLSFRRIAAESHSR